MTDSNVNQLIIADSSPLIAFALLNILPEITSIGKKVMLPETVLQECTHNLALPGAQAIKNAVSKKILHSTPDLDLTKTPEWLSISQLIDPGEAQAIALAQSLCGLLLIDDKAGRRCAKYLGVPITGSLGVLIKLKQTQHIKALKPLLNKLDGHGYRYSDELVRAVLDRVGE